MKRILVTGFAAMLVSVGPAIAQDAPFGTDADAEYAQLLWDAMVSSRLAGEQSILTKPYAGTEPHGAMLEAFYTTATIKDHSGALVVKRNYGPAGVDEQTIMNDAAGHLGAITIMYRREDGYDPDNGNWFWAKYLPDGTLDKNPKGMRLAGRVAKGTDAGCIACHSGAPGEDFLFTTDHLN